MLRLFAGHAAAVHRAGEIAAECRFDLGTLRYEYPKEIWAGEESDAAPSTLPAMTLGEELVADYRAQRLSLRAHPIALIRVDLDALCAAQARRH